MLVILLTMSSSMVSFAKENTGNDLEQQQEFSVEEVKQLEPYVYTENGHLALDKKRAEAAGFDPALVEAQASAFDRLNQQADQGMISIQKDLTIEKTANENNLTEEEERRGITECEECHGKNCEAQYEWWGAWIYYCNCMAKQFEYGLKSAGGVVGMVSVLSYYFPPAAALTTLTSGYLTLLCNRVGANNQGRGICLNMTWIGVFRVDPQ